MEESEDREDRLIPTGTVAKLWGVTPSRVRQILRELADTHELPPGSRKTQGGHYRVPLRWARSRSSLACVFHEEQKR